MATICPKIIHGEDLSLVWADAFLFLMKRGEETTPPFLISVDGFGDGEILKEPAIMKLLDAELAKKNVGLTCDDVAFTIFPHSYWNPKRAPSRAILFEVYKRAYPRLLQRSAPNYRRGTYFQRLVAYPTYHPDPTKTVNQLERILDIWHTSNKRHSGLQASCFDASSDHLPGPYLSFPCLQQVSFDHDQNGGLSVNAFYATQHFFVRAFGNYLGLCHLGQFMAQEMGLRLVRMNCFVGAPRIGWKTKEDLREFGRALDALVAPRQGMIPRK